MVVKTVDDVGGVSLYVCMVIC